MAVATLVVVAVMGSAAACGAGGDTELDEIEWLPPPTPALPLDVGLGEPVLSDAATHFLPLLDDGWQVQPVAAYGERFLLAETRVDRETESAAQRFVLWDPLTNERVPAWETEPGWQDIVTGVDGDLAIYVRTGLALPFPEWTIEARNLLTGETSTIASSRPEVASDPYVKPKPPFGLAPYPAVHDGRLAWVEYVWRNGGVNREVRTHELATGWTITLASVPAYRDELLESATLGGDRVAWVHWSADGHAQMVVHDLTTAVEQRLDLDAKPFALALDGTGETLAWDDERGGKYSVRLDGGIPQRFAGDEGWGVTASGSRFSWAPAAAYGGTAGFFDLATGQLRLVAQKRNVQVNYAAVLGGAFAWQEITTTSDGGLDEAKSGYYFLPLET